MERMNQPLTDLDRPHKPLEAPVSKGNSRHIRYMNLLAKMAVAVEPVAQARIAACIVYHNEIISFGINQRKTHPFQALYGKNKDAIFLHSETDCIKNALKIISVDDLSRCSLYICRVKFEDHHKKRFIFGMAKPCPGCQRAIANFNINTVYYSLDKKGYAKL